MGKQQSLEPTGLIFYHLMGCRRAKITSRCNTLKNPTSGMNQSTELLLVILANITFLISGISGMGSLNKIKAKAGGMMEQWLCFY